MGPQYPRMKPIPPTPGDAYALELLREGQNVWRLGVHSYESCRDMLDTLVEMPQFAGCVFRIRERIRPGVYVEEPVVLALNTAGVL